MVLTVRPIGIVRSPFFEKCEAPRQATLGDVEGRVELEPAYADALTDLDGFERIWLVFWFHLGDGTFRTRVQPPRSEAKRGLFATRSPHRPNPIGLSAVRLVRIEGASLVVRDLDLVDGTPVLDVKPYIAYADAFPDAAQGWLAADPMAKWTVLFEPLAEEQLAFVGDDLRARVVEALTLGPQPHAYRRIKKLARGYVLACKAWRVQFTADGRTIAVQRVVSGYRPSELAKAATPEVHRAFTARFGYVLGP